MRILPFQALYPNLDFITSSDSFFDSVKEEYGDYLTDGFFHSADQEGIYLYRIESRKQKFTGLIANIDIENYLEGRIKKHEQTLTEKEQIQIQLLMKRNAIIKPVLLGYRKKNLIDQWLEKQSEAHPPFLKTYFEKKEETHSLWQITDPTELQYIQELFARLVPHTYIADGHHRITTSAILHQRMIARSQKSPYNRLFCALFASNQLNILNFNRVIDGLHDISATRFMAQIAALFKIKPLDEPAYPQRKHELTLFMEKEWYRLRWRKSVLKNYKNHKVTLDTMLLNEKVLRDIFGIKDVRNDHRIEYVGGALGLDGIRQKTLQSKYNVGFCLYPVQWKEMTTLVDAGEVLPPKSTWFEPRMKSGLIMYELGPRNED